MRYKAEITETIEGGDTFPKLILEVPSDEVLEDLSSVFLAKSVAIVTTPKFVGDAQAKGESLKIVGRLIECCGGFKQSPSHTVTLELSSFEELRAISDNLGKDVLLDCGPPPQPETPAATFNANGDPTCHRGHSYKAKSSHGHLLSIHGLCWLCNEELLDRELSEEKKELPAPRPPSTGCPQCGVDACSFHS